MRLNNGLELYRFRYKGSDRTAYVGVMAQEVQQIEPSAVWRDHDGYLMVNYDRIGVKFMTWTEWLARSGVSLLLRYREISNALNPAARRGIVTAQNRTAGEEHST